MSLQELRKRFRSGSLPKPDYVRAMLERHKALFEYADFLADTDIAAIEITPAGLRFRLKDLPFAMECPAGEARVAPIEILNFSRYEPDETRALLAHVQGCRTILDIGANIGWFALWFAHHAPQATVHAFEPVPPSRAFLERNIALNGLQQRIQVHSVGLSDEPGQFEFFVYPGGSTNASLANVTGASDAVRVVAPTERLDEWVARHGVAPDLIKCDVEGAEFLVFRGAERTLRERRPVVFTEMLRKWSKPFGYHPNEVIAFFRRLGYSCHAVAPQGLVPFDRMTDESLETNFVFLPHG
jgi:FkbM family methyltransferase